MDQALNDRLNQLIKEQNALTAKIKVFLNEYRNIEEIKRNVSESEFYEDKDIAFIKELYVKYKNEMPVDEHINVNLYNLLNQHSAEVLERGFDLDSLCFILTWMPSLFLLKYMNK